MNKSEIKELLFEQVEASDFRDFRKIYTGELVGFRKETTYPFIINDVEYKYIRKIKPKEKRLMTAQELAGKWLVCEYWISADKNQAPRIYKSFVSNVDENTIFMPHLDCRWYPVSELIKLGWKVNDKPSMDGATSLEVEK